MNKKLVLMLSMALATTPLWAKLDFAKKHDALHNDQKKIEYTIKQALDKHLSKHKPRATSLYGMLKNYSASPRLIRFKLKL